MKLKAQDIAVPASILCAVCLIIAGALSVTNFFTKDKIEALNIETERTARSVVLPGSVTFEPGDEQNSYYIGKKEDGSINGYVFTTEGNGYGGTIRVLTGINSEGQITGVNLLSISETPGLGMNAQNDQFRDQYKKTAPANGFSVIKTGTASDEQITALTGATITSNGITNAVNLAIQQYYTVIGSDFDISARSAATTTANSVTISENISLSNKEVIGLVSRTASQYQMANGGA